MERLAPDVLLCLFAGRPDRVELRAPRQGLHFGLEDGTIDLRAVDGKIGAEAGTTLPVDDHWRASGDRVLDVGGLADSFRDGLGTSPGAGDFALQMLWAPEQITFRRP
jgi:hypothetical protein